MCALRPSDRLFVALDTPDLDGALSLAGSLASVVGGVKLGKAFFTANGPEGVKRIAAAGLPVFLDLKFHDIPNTVAAAVRAALPLAPVMLTVHASGGAAMISCGFRLTPGAARNVVVMARETSDKGPDERGAPIP